MESTETSVEHPQRGQNAENATARLVCTENNQTSTTIPYPKRIFLILGNEFCERFNFNGIKAVLSLYLKNKLGFTENDVTILYHGFSMTNNFICIFGGILSDVWLTKSKTILFLSIIYSFGSTIVSISSIPTLSLSPKIILMVGLVLIAVGSGGIKPCVPAFGADQFKLPEQNTQMAKYFSLFYATMSISSLLSSTFTPMLKSEVHCFGQKDCYPLAFGVPALLMLISIVLFLSGMKSYTYKKVSSDNMLISVIKCVTNAIKIRIREGGRHPRKNLLDYSIDKYGEELVEDTRMLFNIFIVYLPLPIFWASFDQTATRWTFQANKMNGNIGFYTIQPDQINVINPLLIIVLIPVADYLFYPLLAKIGIRRPLQRMALVGIFSTIAYVISALVQFKIESSPDKSIHMLWLVPQYVVISIGEVIFNVMSYKFSYEQAPERMKSVVQAYLLLTMAFGNLLLVVIVEFSFFKSQAHEFLLFAGINLIDTFVFMFLGYRFKPRASE